MSSSSMIISSEEKGALDDSFYTPPPPSVADLPHGRVCVFGRVRPMHVEQQDPIKASDASPPATPPRGSREPCVFVEGAKEAHLQAPPGTPMMGGYGKPAARSYKLDGIFDQDASQEDVYASIGHPVVSDVLRGYHGCIMAYGQTGTGKTYNLLNSGTQGSISGAGLVPRAVSDLFVRMAADVRGLYEVSISMCQIYNDQVDDLLKPKSANLQVKKDENGHCYVEGLSWYACKTAEFLLSAFHNGRKRLVYAETHLNKHSSRSHCVLQIKVNRRNRAECSAKAEACKENVRQSITVSQTMGKLTIVDLAGSERIKKSLSEGLRLKEAANINSSLFVLGNVVQALGTKGAHVPYRESSLTKLLEDSLGRMARTCMLVCLSPEQGSYGETHHTLEFASKCMQVEATPECFQGLAQVDSGTLASQLASAFEAAALQQTGEELMRLEAQLNEAKAQAASEVENSRRMRKVADESAQVLWGRVRELEEQLASASERARRAAADEQRQRDAATRVRDELRETSSLLAQERQAAAADRESAAAAARLFGHQSEALAALEGRLAEDKAAAAAAEGKAGENLDRVEARLRETEAELQAEREARAAEAAEAEGLGGKLAAAGEQLASAQEQIAEAHEGWEATQGQVKELQAEKLALLRLVEEAEAAAEETRRAAAAAAAEQRAEHNAEAAALRAELAEARAQHAAAAREARGERTRLMDAAEKSSATAALLVEAMKAAAESEKARAAAEVKLLHNASEMAVVQAKLEEGSKEREALAEEQKALTAAREVLQRQVAEARALADDHAQSRAVEQAAYEVENGALHAVLEELREKVAEAEAGRDHERARADGAEAGAEAEKADRSAERARLEGELREEKKRLAKEHALAEVARQQQAALNARLAEETASVERHSTAASGLTQQLREMREMRATLEADLAAARAEAEAAEARAGEAEARATAGEGALDAARASLLCTGVLVTKHARNGKPYQRFIRATPDGGRLEWASVGDFKPKSGMGLSAGATVTLSRAGDRTVVVQSSDRILTLQMGSTGPEEAAKVLWAEALAATVAA